MEMMPIIDKTLYNADSGISGLFTIHGNGSVTTNHIAASKMTSFNFFFLSGFTHKFQEYGINWFDLAQILIVRDHFMIRNFFFKIIAIFMIFFVKFYVKY